MAKKEVRFNFSEYLEKKGIKDIALYSKLDMHRSTFVKRKEQVQDFSLKEISVIAEHLNMPIKELLDKFLDQLDY